MINDSTKFTVTLTQDGSNIVELLLQIEAERSIGKFGCHVMMNSDVLATLKYIFHTVASTVPSDQIELRVQLLYRVALVSIAEASPDRWFNQEQYSIVMDPVFFTYVVLYSSSSAVVRAR